MYKLFLPFSTANQKGFFICINNNLSINFEPGFANPFYHIFSLWALWVSCFCYNFIYKRYKTNYLTFIFHGVFIWSSKSCGVEEIPLFIWNFVSKIPKKLLIIDSKTWREIFLKLGEFSLKKNIFKDFLNLVNFRPKKI